MGNSLSINGKSYDKTNMPSDFLIQNVKSKKMQRTLDLFDVNSDGIISKDEAQKISLFYETGSATFSKTEDGQTTEYSVYTRKPGKNPMVTSTEVFDADNSNLLSAEYTSYNRKVKESRTDKYKYTHNQDGSVDIVQDTINPKGKLVKTEEGTVSEDGAYTAKRTIKY